jgi:hypothetical protein
MARRFRPLTRAAALSVLTAFLTLCPASRTAFAAPTPTPSPATPSPNPSPVRTPILPTRPAGAQPSAQPSGSPGAKPKPAKPDQWTAAQRIFDQLAPDQKQKFLNNLAQWNSMSPEERELYRDRELFRREKIAQEIQEAITRSGLHLDSDQREVYALRYTQERRKIEEALRKEIDQKRKSMVTDMLLHLKTEFPATPSPTPAGISSSPSPSGG